MEELLKNEIIDFFYSVAIIFLVYLLYYKIQKILGVCLTVSDLYFFKSLLQVVKLNDKGY